MNYKMIVLALNSAFMMGTFVPVVSKTSSETQCGSKEHLKKWLAYAYASVEKKKILERKVKKFSSALLHGLADFSLGKKSKGQLAAFFEESIQKELECNNARGFIQKLINTWGLSTTEDLLDILLEYANSSMRGAVLYRGKDLDTKINTVLAAVFNNLADFVADESKRESVITHIEKSFYREFPNGDLKKVIKELTFEQHDTLAGLLKHASELFGTGRHTNESLLQLLEDYYDDVVPGKSREEL